MAFYILVPFTDYTDTNIVLRLKGNYQSYDLNKNSLERVLLKNLLIIIRVLIIIM